MVRSNFLTALSFLSVGFLSTSPAFSQTFYVKPTEKGFEKKISEKLNYDGFKLSTDPVNFEIGRAHV